MDFCDVAELCLPSGVIETTLSAGVRGDISGNKVTIDSVPIDNSQNSQELLYMNNGKTSKTTFPISSPGTMLENVKHHSNLQFVPRIMVDLGSLYLPFLIISETIEFPGIEVPNIILNAHDNTKNQYKITRDLMPKATGINIHADAVLGSTRIDIAGTTDRINQDIRLTVTGPTGNVVTTTQISPDLNGEFTSVITTDGSLWKQDGFYTVTAQQFNDPKYTALSEVEIQDGVVVPEFGVIATMILGIAITSIIIVTMKSKMFTKL